MFICLFVWLFIDLLIFCFNHHGTPRGSFTENFIKIQLDWRREEGKGRDGILICNGLMHTLRYLFGFLEYPITLKGVANAKE